MQRSPPKGNNEVPKLVLPKQPAIAQPTYNYLNLRKSNYRVKRVPVSADSPFSYQMITSTDTNSIPNDGTYRALPRGDGTFSFSLREMDKTRANATYAEYGLKIHISLDDEIAGNVERGWNAIVPILRYYKVARVKVTDLTRMAKDNEQESTERGKQITIYACLHSPDSKWKNVLYSITKALLANEVKPGYRPGLNTSKEIPNNCYLTYRYDRDPETLGYRKPIGGRGAFPEGVEDPLERQVRNISTSDMHPKQQMNISSMPTKLKP